MNKFFKKRYSSNLSSVLLTSALEPRVCSITHSWSICQIFGQSFSTQNLKLPVSYFFFPGIPFPFSGSYGCSKLYPLVLQDWKIFCFCPLCQRLRSLASAYTQDKTYKSRKVNHVFFPSSIQLLQNTLAFISLSSVLRWFSFLFSNFTQNL